MDGKLPRWLAFVLVAFACTVLGLSVYLERTHLSLLQAHPVMVNLLSSVIGFSFSIVVIAYAINAVVRSARIKARKPRLYTACDRVDAHYKRIPGTIPDSVLGRLGRDHLKPYGYLPEVARREEVARKSVGRQRVDEDTVAHGTAEFLAAADRFIEHSTRLFELLVSPDDEIANELHFATERLESIRGWTFRTERSRTRRQLDGDTVRRLATLYSLAMYSINDLARQIRENPEVRRARRPVRLGPPPPE